MFYIENKSNKFINVILCIIYAYVYDYIYKIYMYGLFDYAEVQYVEMSNIMFLAFISISVFPIVFYKGFINLATAYSFLVYILVYVPCIHSTFVTGEISDFNKYNYIIIFFIMMSVFFLTDNMYLMKELFNRYNKNFSIIKSITIFECITVLIMLYLILKNISSLKFVNFLYESDIMYETRALNAENRSTLDGYLIAWTKGAFLPMLLIYNLVNRKTVKTIVIIVGYVFVFMMDMQKITIIYPIVLIVLYLWLLNDKKISYNFHKYIIISLLIISLLLLLNLDNQIAFSLAAIVILRTQCIAGWLNSIYLSFFETHQYTYFTHINLVNMFTNAYPYDDSLGRVVCYNMMNANANFILMDGYSGLGVVGVIIVGLVFVILKGLLNSISIKYDYRIVLLIFIPAIASSLNVSIFTAMLTCGLMLLYLIFLFGDIRFFKK